MRERLVHWTFSLAVVFVVVMACLPEPAQLPSGPLNRLLHIC